MASQGEALTKCRTKPEHRPSAPTFSPSFSPSPSSLASPGYRPPPSLINYKSLNHIFLEARDAKSRCDAARGINPPGAIHTLPRSYLMNVVWRLMDEPEDRRIELLSVSDYSSLREREDGPRKCARETRPTTQSQRRSRTKWTSMTTTTPPALFPPVPSPRRITF